MAATRGGRRRRRRVGWRRARAPRSALDRRRCWSPAPSRSRSRLRGRRSRAVARRAATTAATRARARSTPRSPPICCSVPRGRPARASGACPICARAAEDVASAVARWRERGWLDRPEAAHCTAAAAREGVDRACAACPAPAPRSIWCSRASTRRRIRRSPRRIARTARTATRTRCSSAIAAARRARR